MLGGCGGVNSRPKGSLVLSKASAASNAPKGQKDSARGFNPGLARITKIRQETQFGGARLPHGLGAFLGTAGRTIQTYFRVLRPPSRSQGVAVLRGLALGLASIIWPTLVHHGYSNMSDRGSANLRPFQRVLRNNLRCLARPLRKFRSLAPPAPGPHRPFHYLRASGLKPRAESFRPFGAILAFRQR
jgi:hypothetical protein